MKRSNAQELELTTAVPEEEEEDEADFHDVLPSGIDAEGNEISLEAYLSLRYKDNPAEGEDRLPPGLSVQGLASTVRRGSYSYEQFMVDGHAEAYLEWFKSKVPHDKSQDYLNSGVLEDHPEYMVEHVAGPDCVSESGYNGNNISVEEMRFCTTLQCVGDRKSDAHDSMQNLPPEPDDEDFERESDYFLTGLLDKCGSWEDIDDRSVYPRRHGLTDVNPMSIDGFELGDKPFHPYCFEMFKRVSMLRLGKMDFVALFDWWAKDHGSDDIPVYPVIQGGQWWEHGAGAELLVAYPLEIPALSAIFTAARRPQEDFDARNSPFAATDSPTKAGEYDPFDKLPPELRHMIVAQLSSKDIANLRLASRSFRHLPNTLWCDLMQREMPWIWEAWSDRPYAFMACTTRLELEAHDKAVAVRMQNARRLPAEERIVQEELIAREDAEFKQPRSVQCLERLHTDWHWLYCQLERERENIKGLQNRERIWKALEFILRRVGNPEEDQIVASDEHDAVFPYRDVLCM